MEGGDEAHVSLNQAEIILCLDAFLDPIVPEGYIHRQTYLACHFLDSLCDLKCTVEQQKYEFENAKAKIDTVLSENTSKFVNEKKNMDKFYGNLLRIIDCKDTLIQIEAFTIALVAGTIGHGKPSVYTTTVAEDILKWSEIRDLGLNNRRPPKRSKSYIEAEQKIVMTLSSSLRDLSKYVKVEKEVVNAALSYGDIPVDVGDFARIVFNPKKDGKLAKREKFDKTEGIPIEYFGDVVQPLITAESRLARVLTFMTVLLAKSTKKKQRS